MRERGHPHNSAGSFGVAVGTRTAFASDDVLRAVRLHPVQVSFALTAAHGTQENAGVFPERPGENGVEEWVGAGVDGVEEHQEDLRVGDGDERDLERCRDGEKRDGRHAQKIGEDEHGHALGDLGVGGTTRELWVAHGGVNAHVAAANHQESADIEEK